MKCATLQYNNNNDNDNFAPFRSRFSWSNQQMLYYFPLKMDVIHYLYLLLYPRVKQLVKKKKKIFECFFYGTMEVL